MKNLKIAVLNGLLFARKGEAAPAAALAYAAAGVSRGRFRRRLRPTSPGAAEWPGRGPEPVSGQQARAAVTLGFDPGGAEGKAPSNGGDVLSSLSDLIRRHVVVEGPAAQPAPTRAARSRRRHQLTVRLDLDDFGRFKDFAQRSDRTYQHVLATAAMAYLDQMAPGPARGAESAAISSRGSCLG